MAAHRFVLLAAIACIGLLTCGRDPADVESFEPELCPKLVNLNTLLSGPGGRLGSPENEETVAGMRTVQAEFLALSGEMSEAGLDEEAGQVRRLASALTEMTQDMEGPDRPKSYLAIAESGGEVVRSLSPILKTFGAGCVEAEGNSLETK